MDEVKYRHRWNEIDERFNEWHSGAPWDAQVKFLSTQMVESFSLSTKQIRDIFKTFHEIYREGGIVSFDWKTYQLPTLVAITVNYVKFKK